MLFFNKSFMKYIFGNLKMYLGLAESHALAQELSALSLPSNFGYAVFPSSLVFSEFKNTLGNSPIALGAQNVSWVSQGAYTGAISAHMYLDAGARYALVGHSERRYIFGETNESIRKKVEACLDTDIVPVVCIGETHEDKVNNTRHLKLEEQLKAIFDGLIVKKPIFLAYEPVWAISRSGMGEACTPSDVLDIHNFIKMELTKYTQEKIPVLYGGSVNSQNIVSYISQESVDGVLVGHASTKADFWQQLEILK